jgi:hypothetical protein
MKDDEPRFRRWLAGQALRSDDTGRLARRAARGVVYFSNADDPSTRVAVWAARLEWRLTDTGTRKRASLSRRSGAVCPTGDDGCGHPLSVHDDTKDGDNMGPCSTPGCDCPGGFAGDPADEESSKAARRGRTNRSRVCPGCRDAVTNPVRLVSRDGASKRTTYWHGGCLLDSSGPGRTRATLAGRLRMAR